jgi:hypothetical protein
LAEVLSLDLPAGTEYSQIIVEAHTRMAQITEEVAGQLSRPLTGEEKAYENVLEDSAQLRSAVSDFLHSPSIVSEPKHSQEESTAQHDISSSAATSAHHEEQFLTQNPVVSPLDRMNLPERFIENLTWAVGECRSRRLPISLMLVELRSGGEFEPKQRLIFHRLVEAACHGIDADERRLEKLAEQRWGLVLPHCDRQEAVRHAHQAIREVNQQLERHPATEDLRRCAVSIGVASVTLPPKNFPPLDLVKAAQRCLNAAQSSETSVVKSLEIF